MKEIPDKSVDLCLTDFPYGRNIDYNGTFIDTQENLKELVKITEPEIVRISKFALITCGSLNIKHYSLYNDIFDIQQPANASFSEYGNVTWQPILVYGKDPHNRFNKRWMSIRNTEIVKPNGHPCPKPINLWKKILLRGSKNETDTILDPFSGSGTTAIACLELNRNYICIEKDPKYYELSVKRVNNYKSQVLMEFQKAI